MTDDLRYMHIIYFCAGGTVAILTAEDRCVNTVQHVVASLMMATNEAPRQICGRGVAPHMAKLIVLTALIKKVDTQESNTRLAGLLRALFVRENETALQEFTPHLNQQLSRWGNKTIPQNDSCSKNPLTSDTPQTRSDHHPKIHF
jgi:hypothetical protein